MGWVPNNPSVPAFTPVDNLVDALSGKLTAAANTCDVFRGKDTKCCENILGCFVAFENLLTTVKIKAIGDQNITRACRDINAGMSDLLACTMTHHSSAECHRAGSGPEIKKSVDALLVELYGSYNLHCVQSPQPPDSTKRPSTPRTTSKRTPKPPKTEKPGTTKPTPTMDPTTLPDIETTSSTSHVNDTLGGPTTLSESGEESSTLGNTRYSTTAKPNNGIITIVTASVGALILLLVLGVVLLVIIKKRKHSEKNASKGSLASNKPFFQRFFKFPGQSTPTNYTEEEIYAEIDDTFMDAVYRAPGQSDQPSVKKRIGSTTQVNVCYGRSAMPDVIMNANDSGKHAASHRDETVTSFKTDRTYQSYETPIPSVMNAKLMLPNQRFIASRPGFSDLRHEVGTNDDSVGIKTANDVNTLTSNQYDHVEFYGPYGSGDNQNHTYDSVYAYGNRNNVYVNTEVQEKDEDDGYEVGWNGGKDLSMVY